MKTKKYLLVLCIIAFCSFSYNGFSQDSIGKGIYSTSPIKVTTYKSSLLTTVCSVGPPQYRFRIGDSVQWENRMGFQTGIIIDLCDEEKCIVKVDNDTSTVLLYFNEISYCAYCSFKVGDRVKWREERVWLTGTIVRIAVDKSDCFAKVDDGNAVIDINSEHSYLVHLPAKK